MVVDVALIKRVDTITLGFANVPTEGCPEKDTMLPSHETALGIILL